MNYTIAFFVLVACLSSGCAFNRPYVMDSTEITSVEGVVTKTRKIAKGTTITLWPADASVHKQKGSAGKTSISFGTDELTQEATGGTNGVESLRYLSEIIKALPK